MIDKEKVFSQAASARLSAAMADFVLFTGAPMAPAAEFPARHGAIAAMRTRRFAARTGA